MSDVVFILGAGASAQGGAPVMSTFLDVAHRLWLTRQAKEKDAQFRRVFEAIEDLQSVFAKSRLDIHNIESIFAAFEMARTLGKFGEYSPEDIEQLLDSIRSVIVTTLDQTLVFRVSGDMGVVPPIPYGKFAQLLGFILKDAKPHQSVSIITFNYDLAIDYALSWARQESAYGFESQEGANAIPLLKLHGSLNWDRCHCGKIVPRKVDSVLLNRHWNSLSPPSKKNLYKEHRLAAHLLDQIEHCPEGIAESPVIVPPTWNKTEYHRQLGAVWGRAARELSEAGQIFVYGYSLPESDAFFRYLFALGTVGKSVLRKVWVFDPDPSGSVERRYRELLGGASEQRFHYYKETFETGIDICKESL